MKKAVSLFLCLLFAVPALAEDRALLVGVGKYRNRKDNLPGIGKDIAAMSEAAELLGFPASGIMTVRDERATLAGLKKAIEDWLVSGVSPRDRVLFYFSGHGSRVRDREGDEADGLDEVLVTHDFGLTSGRVVRGLVDDEFGRLISRIPAKRIFLFIDACHSGTSARTYGRLYYRFLHYPDVPRGRMRGGFAPGLTRGGSDFVMLGAARDNESAVGNELGGYFTRGVAAGIRAAALSKTKLTIRELRKTAEAYIRDNLIQHPKLVHHPGLDGNMKLAEADLFDKTAAVPQTVQEEPPAPTPAEPQGLWSRMERLVGDASYRVQVRANQTRLKIGDSLVISFRVSGPGYVNAFHVNKGDERATVLFPNKHHQDNHVKAGRTVVIPAPGDGFALEARPPSGESLILVLHTASMFNAYQDGVGAAGPFKTMPARSFRGFTDGKRMSGAYGAGRLTVVVSE